MVRHEPTPLAEAVAGAALARRSGSTWSWAIGGGSVLDAAKAVAALATNPGDPLEHVEVIGRGPSARSGSPPAGGHSHHGRHRVGSHAQRGAVLTRTPGQSQSSQSPMLPRVALVDPELTLGLPRPTAATGWTPLTQLLEAYVCSRANPMTDGLCREGVGPDCPALPEAWRDGTNLEARASVQLAAMFSGLALANAGLGAVHGFAGPIGGRFDAPHGAICAALLAPVTAANITALRARMPGSDALRRYAETARWLTGNADAVAEDLPPHLAGLVASMGIPGLAGHGVAEREFADLIRQARSEQHEGESGGTVGRRAGGGVVSRPVNCLLPRPGGR